MAEQNGSKKEAVLFASSWLRMNVPLLGQMSVKEERKGSRFSFEQIHVFNNLTFNMSSRIPY
jgi:hypothetical protein